jgi:hypothetical protein
MRCGIPVLVLTAIEALLLLVCGANEVAREQTAFVRAGDGAAGRPGEEPRSVSDTRGGVLSEPMLDAAPRRRGGVPHSARRTCQTRPTRHLRHNTVQKTQAPA